jgi:hypothetical protein
VAWWGSQPGKQDAAVYSHQMHRHLAPHLGPESPQDMWFALLVCAPEIYAPGYITLKQGDGLSPSFPLFSLLLPLLHHAWTPVCVPALWLSVSEPAQTSRYLSI